MPDLDREPAKPVRRPSEELILAAVERAVRHRGGEVSAVPAWAILEHLSLTARSGEARHVRSRLQELERVGSLLRGRRHGVGVWTLTPAGRQRLAEVRSAGEEPPLPESPQHRTWRNARIAAAAEIERFRRNLADALAEGTELLDAEQPPHSDRWFELAERLQRSAWAVGSATHCLLEWVEPDDAHADIDEREEPGEERFDAEQRTARGARRAGRRNIRLWRRAG